MDHSNRKSGVLLHVTSLPGKFGIGTLGAEAYHFVDFLRKSHVQIWQILPLGPTGFGNSPYQCFSAFAGNPLVIDLVHLHDRGLLTASDLEEHKGRFKESSKVDYETVEVHKMALLRKAYDTFKHHSSDHPDYLWFCEYYADWLNDYTLFMALKAYHGGGSMSEWPLPLRLKRHDAIYAIYDKLIDEVGFHKFLQYFFFQQWSHLKRYANDRGIKIMGDIPIYVSYDSADLWSSPECFEVDETLRPSKVAGVPPDYFCELGQLWGNPVYKWEVMRADDFAWWRRRIKNAFDLYNSFRIDHFRGFSQFWAVPFGETTAINGAWHDAPGMELFESIERHFGKTPIIAEDLGVITPDVEFIRDTFGFPGMKILQYAFDSCENNEYLPHTFTKNCVVYTGTHDNNTSLGWFYEANEEDTDKAIAYMNCEGKSFVEALIRLAWSSVADTAIAPMQDFLQLGAGSRMNTPGTVENNWSWKLKSYQLNDALAHEIATLNRLYGRGSS